MCGINGIILKKEDSQIHAKITQMNDAIIHRGPDDDGDFLKDDKIAMGMRRLSIIDLSTGKQPMFSEDKQHVIVFNGEIYNYRILKESLMSEGVIFHTTSDTEVILKLYEKFGVNSFSLLDGMFAFSIYDATIGKLFIARDYFGEKPLHYIQTSDAFYWASEIKSILKVLPSKPPISKEGMSLYFQLTYIPAPYTIYKEIFKLEANHYIEYDIYTCDFLINEIERNVEEDKLEGNFKDFCNITHDKIQQSVQSRTISDVPIGTFLSGGVDSSIISLCVAQQGDQKIDTFSIGFEKKSFDESDKARTVANLIGSNHHEFIIGEKDLSENIESILLNFDEPFADSSALASYLVAHKTRAFVKVALTGDGGDEVFGGYNKYYMGKLNSIYTNWINRDLHQAICTFSSPVLSGKNDSRGIRFKLARLMKSINYEGDFYYNIISLGFQERELLEILKQNGLEYSTISYYKRELINNNGLKDFRNIDKILSLEGDMLVKVDRTSMLTSLECRAPFLNKDLWDFTNKLPENYLMKGWDKKYILKKAFEKYFPKDFLNKSKKGFGVPVGDWLRDGLKAELLRYIDDQFLIKQDVFHKEAIKSLVLNHVTGRIDNTFKVWTYFCFQKWYTQIYEQ